jgi:formylglycine-generating enzyme required for sulfatase activity
MGCSPGDSDCQEDEKPAHQVTLTKGFWLGQTEVTVAAYKRFAAATKRELPGAPSFNDGWANESMPIVKLDWNDARDYCAWAGGQLPTEAEWERAARGATSDSRYGSIGDVAWYHDNSGSQVHPGGGKRANGFGLYDMLGNLWEWVDDWYDQNYYQNSPTPRKIRASCRSWYYPTFRVNTVGVRCVWEVAGP